MKNKMDFFKSYAIPQILIATPLVFGGMLFLITSLENKQRSVLDFTVVVYFLVSILFFAKESNYYNSFVSTFPIDPVQYANYLAKRNLVKVLVASSCSIVLSFTFTYFMKLSMFSFIFVSFSFIPILICAIVNTTYERFLDPEPKYNGITFTYGFINTLFLTFPFKYLDNTNSIWIYIILVNSLVVSYTLFSRKDVLKKISRGGVLHVEN